jgi:lauroyl/myristoyl acyltransferase
MARKTTEQSYRYTPLEQVRAGAAGETVTFFKRDALREFRQRKISKGDLKEAGILLGALAAVTFLPRKYWVKYTRLVSRLRFSKRRRKELPAFRSAIRPVLGSLSDERAEEIYRRRFEIFFHRRIEVMREFTFFRRPGKIVLHGAEHLLDALAGGKGAIVWTPQFASINMVGEVLAEAGISAVKASATEHGFSKTIFGVSTINRLVVRSENRYLKERLVFDRDGGALVRQRIQAALADGDAVIITNTTHSGSIFAEFPIGHDGFTSMSSAVLSMAARHGTPLICLSIIASEPFLQYDAYFSEVLNNEISPTPQSTSERDFGAMAEIGLRARDHLLDHIVGWPEQYLFWSHVGGSRVGPGNDDEPRSSEASS